MKPAKFDYYAPTTRDEALELLGQHGYDAKVLAGGQSLMPMMNLRLARPAVVVDINRADLLVTTKNYYRRKTKALRNAEEVGKPVYVLRKNTTAQIEQFIQAITRKQGQVPVSEERVEGAMQEAKEAAIRVRQGAGHVELNPQGAYVRRLQHELADQFGLASSSMGRDPGRHVIIYKR